MRSSVAWALVVGVALCVARPDASQTPAPAAQTPQFRAGVDLVELDVSVLDKDRHPVRGLTAKDFTILEDGKPQTIASFAAVDLPDSAPPTAAWMNQVPRDVVTNDFADRRIFVIFIDDALMGASPFWRQTASASAVKLIDGLGPDDLAAVVFSWSDRGAQAFTTDHALLRDAANSLEPGPVRGRDCNPLWSSTGTLRSVVELLAEIPHRRKAVINLGPGAPVDWSGNSGPCQPRMADDANAILAAAQRGNVNVYGLDPGGLRVQGSIRTADFLLTVAGNTGARVIMNTNDPAREVPEILAENSAYYLLGYTPTNVKSDGTFRRLTVKVDRPGVDVRTRKNYYAAKPRSSAPTAREATPAEQAVAGLLPKPDLPLAVTVAPFAGRDGTAVAAIALHVHEPDVGDRGTAAIDLLTRAFTIDGRAGARDHRVATIKLRSDRDPKASADFEVLSAVPVAAGRQTLRLAASDTETHVAGSVYADIAVPNFSGERLSMSGVVLTLTPPVPAAPKDAVADVLPPTIIPTAVREFSHRDTVGAFARVYLGAKADVSPVSLRTTLRDAHDRVVRNGETPIDGAEFRALGTKLREHDVSVPLDVVTLPPGAYLLTLSASMGKITVRGNVQFQIH